MIDSPPFWIGLTGGIGAGKSTVAKVFSALGIPVYDSDERAKWLMANDEELIAQIKTVFGNDSYSRDGALNRDFLAERIFNDLDNTKIINEIVHPAVKKDFAKWASKQDSAYVIKEAALLMETGSYKELFKTINVSSPLKIRMDRIRNRDRHRSEKQINEIINRQLPDEEKNKLADFIVKNTNNKPIIPQILNIHRELMDLIGEKKQ